MAASQSQERPANDGGLVELYGIAADIFRELGGGEEFIREEREALTFRYAAESDPGPGE